MTHPPVCSKIHHPCQPAGPRMSLHLAYLTYLPYSKIPHPVCPMRIHLAYLTYLPYSKIPHLVCPMRIHPPVCSKTHHPCQPAGPRMSLHLAYLTYLPYSKIPHLVCPMRIHPPVCSKTHHPCWLAGLRMVLPLAYSMKYLPSYSKIPHLVCPMMHPPAFPKKIHHHPHQNYQVSYCLVCPKKIESLLALPMKIYLPSYSKKILHLVCSKWTRHPVNYQHCPIPYSH
nr:hypothetical protein Itr_chr09CG06490 [Ipomoea trifida]GMD30246.1 hypothetical protein Iba_chr09aCG5220 [Ipomoea batatas]GMD32135.1 hypothetical protein Iba_chr09bCG5360 [Ipomoea batatas]